MNIEALKAQVEAAKEAAKQKVAESVEIATLKAQLELETSPALLEAKARLAMKQSNTDKLAELIKVCEVMVSQLPIFSERMRDNRKWSSSHRYGYGNQIDLVFQLCTGITYSVEQHKTQMLAHTGLSQELLDSVLKGFGSPAYYSRNNNVVVDEVPYDLEVLSDALDVLQSELGINIDTSELTPEKFQLEFLRGANNANQQFSQAQEAIAEADLQL